MLIPNSFVYLPGGIKRDDVDHPAEVLRLAGIRPGMIVADFLAGDTAGLLPDSLAGLAPDDLADFLFNGMLSRALHTLAAALLGRALTCFQTALRAHRPTSFAA